MQRHPALVITLVALLRFSAPLHAQQQASFNPSPASLNAANGLIAIPWPDLVDDKLKPFRKHLTDVSGEKFVDGSGNGWEFSLAFDNLRLDTNTAALAPGLKSTPGGFIMRAPLNGSWSFAIAGDIKAHAWAGSKTTIGGTTVKTNIVDQDVIVPFTMGVDDISVAGFAGLDTGDPVHPRLINAVIQAHARVGGSVLFPPYPIDLDLARQPDGSLSGEFSLTRELGIPDFVAVDEGVRLVIRLLPFSTNNTWILFVGLEGALYVQFPDPIGRVSLPSSPFFSMPLVIPSPAMFSENIAAFVEIARGPIPRPWPPAGSPPPAASLQVSPPASFDFATARDAIEAGIAPARIPSHMPSGMVLSIDYAPPDLRPVPIHGNLTPAFSYGIDADSPIWTGHYLTAEAFRYAATHSSEALDRVKAAIAGLEINFNVTTDVVLANHQYVVVPADIAGNVFARSTLLHNDGPGEALPDWIDSITARKTRGMCLYVKPSGGWKVGKVKFPTYAAAQAAPRPKGLQGGTLTPAPVDTQPIRYGSGCGSNSESDNPISRDQYSGVFMGLAYAYALVPDVQADAKKDIETALDFLLIHHWNVPMPPDRTISTTFIGNIDVQLSMLRIGASIDPTHVPQGTSQSYQQLYTRYAPASALCWLPVWVSTFDPLDKYYKYNLSHAYFSPLLFLETDPALRANYLTAYNIIRAATATHRNAYFNLVDILAGAATSSSPSAANPQLTFGDEIKGDIADWVTRWNAVKDPDSMPRNVTSESAAVYLKGLWPDYVRLYTNIPGGVTGPLSQSWRSTYPLPLQDRIGSGMEFIWQNTPSEAGLDWPPPGRHVSPIGLSPRPQTFDCSTNPPTTTQLVLCSSESNSQSPGVDYLLAYWLAVYLKVLTAP